MKGLRWMLVIVAVAVAAGPAACGSEGGSCEDVTPASCPEGAPSYASDVAPLLQKYCTKCHAPGGEQSSIPFDTLSGVQAYKAEMQHELGECEMPPAGDSQPSAAEREKILAWLVCGAADN
jgi:uncharacterized membrane protein